MTCRATRQDTGALNVVLLDQLQSQRALICFRSPIHVEDLLARAQESFRRSMAVETPFHLQRLLLPHERHAIDRAMAGRAADPFVNVNTVVKINEVSQIMHALPANRRAALITVAHRLQNIAARPDLRMTVHASCRRRQAGERGNFHRGMAVTTIDAKPADMMLVAERHGLHAHDIGFDNIGGTGYCRDQPKQRAEQKHQPKNT